MLQRRKQLRRRKAVTPGATTRASATASPGRTRISGGRGRHQGVTAEVRERVIERDGGCVMRRFLPRHACWGSLQVHHRKRRSQSGDDDPVNLVTLCAAGHHDVHQHPGWAYSVGLLLHSWDPVTPLEEM